MPHVKNLNGLERKNNRAARAARTYEQVRAVFSKKKQPKITLFDDNLNIKR